MGIFRPTAPVAVPPGTPGTTGTTTTTTHPVLRNLLTLLTTYGPVLLQWLVTAGILKLPAGVSLPTLPPLPPLVSSQYDRAALAASHPDLDIEVEVDPVTLAQALDCHAALQADIEKG